MRRRFGRFTSDIGRQKPPNEWVWHTSPPFAPTRALAAQLRVIKTTRSIGCQPSAPAADRRGSVHRPTLEECSESGASLHDTRRRSSRPTGLRSFWIRVLEEHSTSVDVRGLFLSAPRTLYRLPARRLSRCDRRLRPRPLVQRRGTASVSAIPLNRSEIGEKRRTTTARGSSAASILGSRPAARSSRTRMDIGRFFFVRIIEYIRALETNPTDRIHFRHVRSVDSTR
jgi:hypothetical protein